MKTDFFQGLIDPGDNTAKDPWGSLASSVCTKAIADWRMYGTLTETPKNASYRKCLEILEFDSPREELLEFFRSDWFEFLTGVAPNLDVDLILKTIGVTK